MGFSRADMDAMRRVREEKSQTACMPKGRAFQTVKATCRVPALMEECGRCVLPSQGTTEGRVTLKKVSFSSVKLAEGTSF